MHHLHLKPLPTLPPTSLGIFKPFLGSQHREPTAGLVPPFRPRGLTFDVLVIDEASQLPPVETLGAAHAPLATFVADLKKLSRFSYRFLILIPGIVLYPVQSSVPVLVEACLRGAGAAGGSRGFSFLFFHKRE